MIVAPDQLFLGFCDCALNPVGPEAYLFPEAFGELGGNVLVNLWHDQLFLISHEVAFMGGTDQLIQSGE